jgi:hypothetical protein
MSATEQRGLQFFITTVLFLILFVGFYFLFIRDTDEDSSTTQEFDIAFIDDRMLTLSDAKGEKPLTLVKAVRVAWSPDNAGLYYLDNYAKLKFYDTTERSSRDIILNSLFFSVSRSGSPDGDMICVGQDVDGERLKIISVLDDAIEEQADLGRGTLPRWSGDGNSVVFLRDGDIYKASGGTWTPTRIAAADALDLAVSVDGSTILYTEWTGRASSLVLLDVSSRKKTVIKEASFAGEPTAALPLGFSCPRFFAGKNEALFVYNDEGGGRVFRFSPEDETITGLAMEGGPIFSLSVSGDDSTITYFFINVADQPRYTKKTDGEEVPLPLGPEELNSEFAEKLFKMADNNEIGGDEINKYNVERIMESDIIRVVDIEREVFWILGSGQYPVVR